ncbi:MAG: DUF1801 domain-containing protein [Methanolobus sp.]
MKKSNSQSAGENISSPETIDEYLSGVPEDAFIALTRLRKIIHDTVPDAVEGISYKIPAFRYNGPLVGFAAFQKHCSFYLMSTAVMDAHREELKAYDTAKGTIRFQPDNPLPEELIVMLVKARIVENDEIKK